MRHPLLAPDRFLFVTWPSFCHKLAPVSAVSELPHLIRLLDDETDVVRRAVRERLEVLRKDLPDELEKLNLVLSDEEDRLLSEVLAPSYREELVDRWMQWRELPDEHSQLESALSVLAAFLSGWKSHRRELGRRMRIRAVPKLEFRYDEIVERGARLSALIDAAVAADADKHRDAVAAADDAGPEHPV